MTIEYAEKIARIDKGLVKKAKEIYEEAYYRNTFIGAENSMGFHNPTEALRVLGDALDLGRQAEILAQKAILKAGRIPPDLSAEKIDEIVAKRYRSKDGKTGYKLGISKKAALLLSP